MPRSLLGGLIVAVVLNSPNGGPALSYEPRASAPVLVPAQFRTTRDSKGFSWNLNNNAVQFPRNGAFHMAMVLQIANSGINWSNALMTPDQAEYHLKGEVEGQVSGVELLRRIRLDSKTATLRIVDTWQNNQAAPQVVDLQVVCHLRGYPATCVLAPSGTMLAGRSRNRGSYGPNQSQTALDEKNCGLVVAGQDGNQNSPAVLCYLAGRRGEVRPTIRIQGSQVIFNYSLSLPPHRNTSLVYGLSQQMSPSLGTKELAQAFKVFESRSWTADLPEDVRKSIVNLGRGSQGSDLPEGPLLQRVLDLAEQYHVERDQSDYLVQGKEKPLSGKLSVGELAIEGRLGKSAISLDDVALLAGGMGSDRPSRVFLRNGEILTGDLRAKDLVFKTARNLELRLDPARLKYVFLRTAKADGVPPPGTVALIETHAGERLAVRNRKSLLRAATPWGPLEFTVGEVRGLVAQSEPQPTYRLILRDGSQLPVVLQDDQIVLSTVRLGDVKLSPLAVAQIRGIGDPAPVDEAEEEERLKVPACFLAGENILAGTLADPKFELRTETGSVSIRTERIVELRRDDDQATVFHINMGDGEDLTGMLAEPVVKIRHGAEVWEFPVQHVQAWRSPKPESPSKKAAGPSDGASRTPALQPVPSRGNSPSRRRLPPRDDDPFADGN